MCAQYSVKAQLQELLRFFHVSPVLSNDTIIWPERILPTYLAPVILNLGGERALRRMRFSLLPVWSREERVKFATHNARVESVLEKPTWRDSFLERRCLVPISGFLEPIYENQYAGTMVEFFGKNRTILVAAGIWDRWVSLDGSRKIFSFAILTQTPNSYIANIGHDRMPLFLAPETWDEWIRPGRRSPEVLQEILKFQDAIEFDVRKDRDLKQAKPKAVEQPNLFLENENY